MDLVQSLIRKKNGQIIWCQMTDAYHVTMVNGLCMTDPERTVEGVQKTDLMDQSRFMKFVYGKNARKKNEILFYK